MNKTGGARSTGKRTIEDYRDLLDLPHPVSRRHPPMPRENRAGQFSPFASLKGYEDLIEEGAREAEDLYGREEREEYFD